MPEILVLDCSIAAKWLLPEPGRGPALKLLDRYEAGEIGLIAPDLLLAEFASLLGKRHRRKQISAEQAYQAYNLMTKSAPRLYETRPLLLHALDLSLRHRMSLWDCVYLALAREHNCDFLTADQRLFRSGAARHPSLRLLS
jgi:predicted nucleic acid-binding protein